MLNNKTALIAGASGLIGSELLQILLAQNTYDRVIALVRTPLNLQHPRLEQVICDFDQMHEVEEKLKADDIYCCLGTTIKKAKTKEAMFKVDVEYPTTLAKITKQQGASHYLVVSSTNANPKSPLWYPRMKGQLEENLKNLDMQALTMVRPSLLLGERQEYRFLENLAAQLTKGLSKLLGRPVPSQLAIESRTVAWAMYRIAQEPTRGTKVYLPKDIERIGKASD